MLNVVKYRVSPQERDKKTESEQVLFSQFRRLMQITFCYGELAILKRQDCGITHARCYERAENILNSKHGQESGKAECAKRLFVD
jgi:hypothetical protein